MSDLARRPGPDEYNEFYGTYVQAAVQAVAARAESDGGIVAQMQTQLDRALELWTGLPEPKRDHRYAEGKWSLRQLLGHVIDAERIFSYRALCIARGDRTALPGMNQDEYMDGARFDDRSWQSLVDEYRHQRLANLALFGSFDEDALDRKGTASAFPVTVRALLWIVAGHELHHLRIVDERYLG